MFNFTKAFMNLHKVNYPPVSEDVRLNLRPNHATWLKYLYRGWKTIIYAGLKKHELIRLDDNDPMFKLFKFNSNQDYLSKLMPDIDEQTPYNYLIRQFVCYIYNCQHLNVFLYTKNTMEISISTNMIRLFQKLFGKISNFKMNKSNLHVKTRMYFDCMYMHDIISDIVDKYETQKLNAF